jgi:hypothetical protein
MLETGRNPLLCTGLREVTLQGLFVGFTPASLDMGTEQGFYGGFAKASSFEGTENVLMRVSRTLV